MKIGIVCKEESGVAYHRLIKPFSLMTEHEVIRCEGVSEEMFDYGFDVVVFNRVLPITEQKKFIRKLQSKGVYVICDVDDHWILSSNHTSKSVGDAYRQYSIEALMYADEVWTTHELLGKEVERLNANWYVIPNALDPNDPQWRQGQNVRENVREPRIGWAGGITHFHDLMLTKDAWNDTTPVICGFNEHPEWLKLSDNFKADYINALPVTEYGLLYDQFDIAIAPLEDNKFNRCKSNLKIIEAGMKGLPIFTQNIHPYTDETRGIFKVDDWGDAIRQATNWHREEIRDCGSSLREYVMANYDLNKVNELRKERLG